LHIDCDLNFGKTKSLIFSVGSWKGKKIIEHKCQQKKPPVQGSVPGKKKNRTRRLREAKKKKFANPKKGGNALGKKKKGLRKGWDLKKARGWLRGQVNAQDARRMKSVSGAT